VAGRAYDGRRRDYLIMQSRRQANEEGNSGGWCPRACVLLSDLYALSVLVPTAAAVTAAGLGPGHSGRYVMATALTALYSRS
jgi:hypothetical protein